jgi:hypothetical protein
MIARFLNHKYLIPLLWISSYAVCIQDSTLATFPYNGAGILPIYTRHGRKWVVVSREVAGRNKGTYDSFSGSRAKTEHIPIDTAAREGAEELIAHRTLGMDILGVKNWLTNHTDQIIALQQKQYVLYVARLNHDQVDCLKKNFYSARNESFEHCYREKDRLAFVSWSNLETMIHAGKTTVMARVLNQNTNQLEKKIITIRPILIATLQAIIEQEPKKIEGNIYFYS